MRQQKQPVALLFLLMRTREGDYSGLLLRVLRAEGLDENGVRHMKAFYALLQKWYLEKEYTSVLLSRADYDERVRFSTFFMMAVTVGQVMLLAT